MRARRRRPSGGLRLLAAAGAAVVAGLGGAAEAWACKPYLPQPAEIVGPTIREPSVAVTRGGLVVRCDEAAGGRYERGVLRCRVRTTHRLEHRGAAPVVAHGEVLVRRAEGLSIRRGDVDLGAPAPAPDRASEALAGRGRGDPEEARAFEIALAAGERVEITVDTEVVVELWSNGCQAPSIIRRHARWGGMIYGDLALYDPDQQAAPVEVEVDLPRRYGLEREFIRIGAQDLDRARAGPGRRRLRGRVSAGRWHSFQFVRDRHLLPGGPLVAAGVDLGSGRPRPRLRVGYELAAPVPWWIHALAVESDLKAMTLVPTTEVASASAFWLPSAGLGVGAPLRVYPEVRAGVRAQLTLHWIGRIAAVGTFDVYPVKSGRDELRGGVMLQLGL